MSDYQSTSGDCSLTNIPQIGNNENSESIGAISDGGASGGGVGENLVQNNGDKKRTKPGILRLDISKPRRSSGGSVEFRTQPELLGEVSPSVSGTTSPPQLSVTWATQCDINERSNNSRQMQNIIKLAQERAKRPQDERPNELSPELTSPTNVSDEHNSEEEDYSLSVNAIIQRRASLRGHRKKGRGSRRTSSPLDNVLEPGSHLGDRRRSSVYTTSSGDTAISFDDGTNQDSTQEQIYENIRLHKEVIQSVKYQPWSIRRKLKLVRQAKTYVARHEGALQERFAMSRSTKDLWARFKILMAARWRHWKREIASFLTVLIPWELRIKEIESHFGSGVASYFTFLRWLLWVNIMIAIPLLTFVIIPELLASNLDHSIKDNRKIMTPGEMKKAGNVVTIWEFEGYLKYSPLFYGFYSNESGAIQWGYNLPLAYFLTSVGVYIYSFVATLRKMAENSRTSKLSLKDDECVFSWKLFTGWDFMIGHAETAHNRIASVVVGFKEALLEEAEKRKDNRNWRIILQRILVNILVTGLLAASGYTVVLAVDRSEMAGANDTWFRRNEVNVIMTLLSFVLPMMFDALGLFENWHPRQQLRLQLARIMILNLLNLYSLMFSFIYKITGKDESLQLLRNMFKNATEQKDRIKEILDNFQLDNITTTVMNSIDWTTNELSSIGDNLTSLISNTISSTTISNSITTLIDSPTTIMDIYNQTQCYLVPVNCSKPPKLNSNLTLTTTLLLLNLSTTILPEILTTLSTTTPILTTSTTELTTPTTTSELITTSTIKEYPSTTIFDYTTRNDYDDLTTNEPTTPDYDNYMNNVNDSFFFYSDYFDNIDSSEIDEDFDNSIDGNRFKRNNNVNIKNLSSSSEEEEENNNESSSNDQTITTTKSSINIDQLYKQITNVYDSLSKSLSNEYGFNINDNNLELNHIFHTTLSTFIDNITMILDKNNNNNINNNSQRFEYSIDNENIIRDKIQEYINNVTTTITDNYDDMITSTIYPDYDDNNNGNGENCTKWVCGPITTIIPTQPMDYYDSNGILITKYPIIKDEKYYDEEYKRLDRTLLSVRKNLSTMCWETSLGQELSKVIVFDAIMSIAAPLFIDFIRALFVRYINDYWCWDMEKTFPQYGDFKIAESILNLVYNQGQVWMGIFFSPGLVIINLVKLIILMYLRSWIVLTCNVPHEVVFKASKSNNFYLSLLLTMLFLCVLPVGYAIVWLRPSWHCGPFSKYTRISEFFTNTTRNALPESLHKPLEYMTSSSTIIPLLLLLILIIYYLVSLTGALREANQDLRTQLQKERMEERKKIFKIPEDKPAETTAASITSRWKRVLEASSPLTPTGPPLPPDPEETKMLARKELLSRIMRKALRKASVTSDDESLPIHGNEGDETDTEHHDPLPYDEEHKKRHGSRFPKLHGNRRARKPSLIDIVAMARKDSTTPTNEPHPKDQYKINRNIVDAKPNDNDPEDNSRIVSERRKSLLRRQPKFGETQGSNGNQQTSEDPNANYEIVNEKNKEVEMKSKQKANSPKEPNVFKFESKHDGIQQKKSLTDVFFKPHSHQSENTSGPSSPNIIDKPLTGSSFGVGSGGGEKLAALSRQGKKRIGSFLALVKEAVNKKSDSSGSQSDESQNPSPCDTPETIIPPILKQTTTAPTVTPLPAHVSKPEQKQKSAQETTNITARSKEPLPASASTSTRNGTEKKPHKERLPPKRQDSQTSIPVITISKTGSEECILEYSDKDIDDK